MRTSAGRTLAMAASICARNADGTSRSFALRLPKQSTHTPRTSNRRRVEPDQSSRVMGVFVEETP